MLECTLLPFLTQQCWIEFRKSKVLPSAAASEDTTEDLRIGSLESITQDLYSTYVQSRRNHVAGRFQLPEYFWVDAFVFVFDTGDLSAAFSCRFFVKADAGLTLPFLPPPSM